MCRCNTQPNALRRCFEISAVAVVVLALAWLKIIIIIIIIITTISKKKERKFESGVLTAALLQMGRLACQQHQNALLSVQGAVRAEL